MLAALNATLPGNVLGGAANGTTQTAATYFNEVLDTIYKVRYGNEEPNGLIWNAKVARQYAGANDTTGQPLRLPADVEGIPRYVSNQVPSYTQGTMTNRATDLFAGDWTQLLIGQRLGLTIQVLTERYADYGQVGIVAHWRGDVAPAGSSAFSVYRGIQGGSVMKKVEEQRRQLEDAAGLESAEAATTVVPESGRGLTANTARHRFAQDYVHATNPETGMLVVFVPGEALPD